MIISCYNHDMANLHVRNVPDALYERLRRYARRNGCTISSAVLAAVEREIAMGEWNELWEARPATNFDIAAADLLKQERSLRRRGAGE